MDEQKEVVTDAMDDLGAEVTEITELPPVEDSTGIGTLLWGAAKIGAIVTGVGFAGTKVSQKLYARNCAKKDVAPQTREKFYQFWRPKAKKVVKGDGPVIDGEIHEVDPESDEED